MEVVLLIRNAIARFMYGRNGLDQLGMLTLFLYLLIEIIRMFSGWYFLLLIEYLLLFLTLFRMLSRNLDKRRAENAKFLQVVRPIKHRFLSHRARVKDKEHRYFKCPNCGQQMRVPKGKGRITVHCRTCGATFEEKS